MIVSKPITKQELRQILSMSATTLRRYTNKRYFAELTDIGYNKFDNLLTAKQANFLIEKLGIVKD